MNASWEGFIKGAYMENDSGTIIRCSVQNCMFWREGNYCSAKHVLVTSDIVAGAWLKDADEAAMAAAPQSPVEGAEGSCCATFREKGGP